jgi:general secretion pathway protein L
MKSVGIDIGTSSIKVVEVVSGTKGVTLAHFVERPIGQNPAHDPELEIIEFLRELFASYDPASTRVVLGLRQDRVSVRNKLFPFSDRQKILKSLPFELEEDLPFSNETAIFDAKIIRQIGNTAEVLACATPKLRVAGALQMMTDANLDISILSPEGIALANCFERWNDPIPTLPSRPIDMELQLPERLITIQVHIGHNRTLVAAYENNLLIGARTILWGAKNVADAIARRYEIPFVEAMKEMQTKSFILPSKEGASYDQIVFSDTISSQVKELSRELKISILEFKAEFNGVVQSVNLSGGGSQILNLHAHMTQLLELPVNKANCLAQFPNVGFEKSARTEAIIGVALGLAIEGLKKPRNPAVNFLRGEFARQNMAFKIFWERWAPVIKTAAAAFVIFVVYAMIRDDFAVSLADRTDEVLKTQAKVSAKLPAKAQNETGVKKYIREQKQRDLGLKALSSVAHMNSALDLLHKINDAVPAKNAITLNVRQLAIQEDSVHIEGTVASPREVTLLQQALTQVSSNGRVDQTPSRIVAPPGSTPFSFNLRMDRGLKAEK